jgi:tetrathionate reductase subunit B
MLFKDRQEPNMREPRRVSRRDFLKALPAVTAGAAAVPAKAASSKGPHWAMLIDLRDCIGCQACSIACSMENQLPEGCFRTSALTYVVHEDQKAGAHMLPRLCNHCDEPPCVPVCPVGATFKRDDGVVLVDAERCVGCGYCVQACPYDARFINTATGKADKCTFCAHRIEAGLLPACVETCVGGARVFGDLNDAKSELRRRLTAAKGQVKALKPEQRTRPNVFYVGLDETMQRRFSGAGVPAALTETVIPGAKS